MRVLEVTDFLKFLKQVDRGGSSVKISKGLYSEEGWRFLLI